MARVLVVDDEPDARESLAVLLEFHGHEVTTAANGREALHILDKGTWDVLVLDILMPDVDGIEVLLSLRKYHGLRAPRVLAISGGGTHHDLPILELATKCGAHATMEKPVEPRAVTLAVNALAGAA